MWHNHDLHERLGIRICFYEPGPGSGDNIDGQGPDNSMDPNDSGFGDSQGASLGEVVGGIIGGLIGSVIGGRIGRSGEGATVGSGLGTLAGEAIENAIRDTHRGNPDGAPAEPSPHSDSSHGISASIAPTGKIVVTLGHYYAALGIQVAEITLEGPNSIKSIDLFSSTVLLSRTTYDTSNTASFSKMVEFLDSAGRVTEQRVHLDSRELLVNSFDHSGRDWSLITDNYDASGARTRQNVYYDNGDYQFNYWDVQNTTSWDFYSDRHIANGARQTERVYNDDGSYRFYYYDASNQNTWSQIVEEFDTSGARTIQRVFDDNGARHVTYFDPNNTQSWSHVQEDYTVSGVRTQTIFYDNGTILVV